MKKWFLIVSLSLTLAIFGFLLGAFIERNKDITFSSPLWKLGGIAQTAGSGIESFRHKMVNDLLKRYGVLGSSKAEIIALLGDEGGPGDHEDKMYYWLTEIYFCLLCIDPTSVETLVMEFNSNGYVEKAYVSRVSR